MLRWAWLVGGAPLALLASPLLTYTLTGEITSTTNFNGDVPSGIQAGTSFVLVVTADPTTNYYSSPLDGFYRDDASLSSFTMGGYAYFGDTGGNVEVLLGSEDDFVPETSGSGLPPGTSGSNPPAGEIGVWVANVDLEDSTGTALSTDALPTTLNLSSFALQNAFQLDVVGNNLETHDQTELYEATGTITSVSVSESGTPEPSSALSLLAATAALVVIRRFYRKYINLCHRARPSSLS